MTEMHTTQQGTGTVPPVPAADDSTLFEPIPNHHRRQASATLANISLFKNLSPEMIDFLSSHAVVRSYGKNTIVIQEGDLSDSLYVILAGRVRVFLSDEEGKQVDLNLLGPGEYFGELAALDHSPRCASVMTTENCKFAVISKTDFYKCLQSNPIIAVHLIDVLVQRFRDLTENVKSLALMDVYGRVARTLLNLATQAEDGTMVIEQKLTQRELANMVGASREMVSRILRDLTVGGYVAIKNKTIVIQEKLPPAW